MAYPYPSRNKQMAVLIGVAALVATITVIALNMAMLQNSGNVSDVHTIDIEVYWDIEHANKVSSIDWGSVEPGTAKNVTVYVLNGGNTNVGLSMNTTNWSSPNASDHITLSWDYKSQKIAPSQLQRTTLTLYTSPNIQGVTSFSFDIIVSATEYP